MLAAIGAVISGLWGIFIAGMEMGLAVILLIPLLFFMRRD